MPYRHDRDAPKLRNVLATLTREGGVTAAVLIHELAKLIRKKPDELMDSLTLKRFIAGEGRKKKAAVLAELWEFLHAHARYKVYFDETDDLVPTEQKALLQPALPTSTLEGALSDALRDYLLTEKDLHHYPMGRIQKIFPANYVMYRADLRPYALKVDSPPRFRASNLEISTRDDAVHIKEVQDFPQIGEDDALSMTIEGVMFPYGRFVMFLMRALEKESLRLGVIDRTYTFVSKKKAQWFHGSILVASEADMFPSTKFFCLQDDGNLKTGRITFNEIPSSAARAYLKDAHDVAATHYGFKLKPVIKS